MGRRRHGAGGAWAPPGSRMRGMTGAGPSTLRPGYASTARASARLLAGHVCRRRGGRAPRGAAGRFAAGLLLPGLMPWAASNTDPPTSSSLPSSQATLRVTPAGAPASWPVRPADDIRAAAGGIGRFRNEASRTWRPPIQKAIPRLRGRLLWVRNPVLDAGRRGAGVIWVVRADFAPCAVRLRLGRAGQPGIPLASPRAGPCARGSRQVRG